MNRAQKAANLLKLLSRGPIFSAAPNPGSKTVTLVDASSQYRNWATSWVIDDLVSLIPELRRKRDALESDDIDL